MTFRLLPLAVLPLAALACTQASTPGSPQAAAPMGPSSAVSAAATSAHASGRESVLVNIMDACDPISFGEQGVDCTRSGGMTFDQFIAELTRLAFVGPWHFSPSQANVRAGGSFVAVNKGGEVHTFTEVKEFGGGIVPPLNVLTHVPTITPECAALEGDDFIPPGGTYHEDADQTGTVKFQCCIHPWMRLEANVTAK